MQALTGNMKELQNSRLLQETSAWLSQKRSWIEEVIEQKGGSYLESYKLFDLYEGAQIKAGYKSIAYSIVFRAKDKTLEDADVTKAMGHILKELEGMGIELRK